MISKFITEACTTYFHGHPKTKKKRVKTHVQPRDFDLMNVISIS